MNQPVIKWRRQLTRVATNTQQALRARTRQLAAIIRNPRAVAYWLRTAHAAQIALLVTALLMPTVISTGSDWLIGKIYQPVKVKHLFGLIQADQQNPLLERRQQQAHIIFWLGSGGLVIFLLMRRLPGALGELRSRARELEQTGDSSIKTQPSATLRNYQAALEINTDAEHTRLLRAKISSLDEDLRWQQPGSGTTRDESTGLVGDRYRLESELGRGAMGVVYAAHDLRLERDVALKRMIDPGQDYQMSMRFKQEAKALAKLNHPHIVQVHDVVSDQGFTWIAMELVKGRELADSIAEAIALTPEDILRFGDQLTGAMAYAHARGVIHRDFKPANVLIDESGMAKIMDFGMARLAHQSGYTVSGTLIGSPAYMSPEQGEGKPADERSDIYALGMTFYEMATGRVPFEGDTMVSVLVQHATRAPASPASINPALPAALSQLILDMIAKDPDQRPASMDIIRARLASIQVG